MASVSVPIVPPAGSPAMGEYDFRCESCGYSLANLPTDRCPECGQAVAESDPSLRGPTRWEQSGGSGAVGAFVQTSAEVLFHPRRFYRGLLTRAGRDASRRFAKIHHALVALLFSCAALFYYRWLISFNVSKPGPAWAICLLLVAAAWGIIEGLHWFAARLTAWEARYWNMRLPIHVVQRGMDYHAAHLIPVGLVAAVTTAGYFFLSQHRALSPEADTHYLYLLCGEVIVAAGYLFRTYWIGMRNMMYANA